MKRYIIICFLLLCGYIFIYAQTSLSLDSCRELALLNNTQLQIAREQNRIAKFHHKEAITSYFPKIDFIGGYIYNSREISILDNQLRHSLPRIGSSLAEGLRQMATSAPELAHLLAALGGIDIENILNNAGQSVIDALSTDTRHIYAGTISLTQPLYLGGKIRAYNKIAQYAEKLSESEYNTILYDLLYRVDELYWQIVSLTYKKGLAESYASLLDTLSRDITIMYETGIATQSDILSVAVKKNEAHIDLSRVDNGLKLAKMVLAQVCGLPINDNYQLTDTLPDISIFPLKPHIDTNEVYLRRSELESLMWAEKIYRMKQRITLSNMLPSIALSGNYIISNPNIYNGFEREFKSSFNINIGLSIPLLHWGENIYKYKTAKRETVISQLKTIQVQEMVELQVNQASESYDEALERLETVCSNLNNADENLRNAQIGLSEGLLTTSNVLEAQTAWLKAHSELIDARIDMQLCYTYLLKVLGENEIK